MEDLQGWGTPLITSNENIGNVIHRVPDKKAQAHGHAKENENQSDDGDDDGG